ncbi:MAG TPA: YggT family protein [Burkholderiales bacterium]|jgi:YggT family protein
MLTNALIFLVNTVCGLFVVALLLRFYLQWARAPYRNPLSEFLQALTDFMVRPARRLVPGLWGLDLSTLALAWLVQWVEILLVLQIKEYGLGPAAGQSVAAAALLALVMILKIGLYVVMAAVIVQVVLSWVSPHSPLMSLANSMTRPFLRVFQRRVPPIGNVDLSPLFVLVVIQLLLMLPVAYLEAVVGRLL